jgi:hypothetical protein
MESSAPSFGWFWLPEHPEHQVHGSVSHGDDGIQLEVAGTLQPPAQHGGGSPRWVTIPVILGRLHDGRDVTLLQASGDEMTGTPEEVTEEYQADFALDGGHVTEDCFARTRIVFDYLMPWVNPPGIVHENLADGTFTVDPRQTVITEAALTDGRTVRLLTGAYHQHGKASAHVDQWCAFEVEGSPAPIADILSTWVRPLQDLLVICLGQPVRLEEMLVSPPGHPLYLPEPRLLFDAVQPPGRKSTPVRHPGSHGAPTLLTLDSSPLPFDALIQGWTGVYERLATVVTLASGPFYAPFIYSQHRYSSAFQAAEALATASGLGGRQMTRPEHRGRVEAVTAALEGAGLDAAVVSWATNVIRGRNDKPLWQLIEELISSADGMGAQLLTAAPDLASRAATTRAGVSHPRPGVSAARERRWLGEALTWVVRVKLLAELGISVDELSAIAMATPAFQHLIEGLDGLATPQALLPGGTAEVAEGKGGSAPGSGDPDVPPGETGAGDGSGGGEQEVAEREDVGGLGDGGVAGNGEEAAGDDEQDQEDEVDDGRGGLEVGDEGTDGHPE